MGVEIINIRRKPGSGGGKANGTGGANAVNTHTVRAEDLRIHKPIVGQGSLSMVLKLK